MSLSNKGFEMSKKSSFGRREGTKKTETWKEYIRNLDQCRERNSERTTRTCGHTVYLTNRKPSANCV